MSDHPITFSFSGFFYSHLKAIIIIFFSYFTFYSHCLLSFLPNFCSQIFVLRCSTATGNRLPYSTDMNIWFVLLKAHWCESLVCFSDRTPMHASNMWEHTARNPTLRRNNTCKCVVITTDSYYYISYHFTLTVTILSKEINRTYKWRCSKMVATSWP